MSNENYRAINNDLKYWIAIAKTGVVGSTRFKKLGSHFPDMEKAFLASFEELIEAGIDAKTAEEFISKRKNISPDEETEKMAKENIRAITLTDKQYPALLKEIYDAPPVLFYKGNIEILDEPGIGVVGSRKISSYGQQTTPFLVKPLAKRGMVITSGLALGVDAIAHSAALEVQGKTTAVLGSGLDKANIYPSHHRYLSDQIVEKNGVIISEYTVGTPPLNYNFPQRNRIISGLSLGVLIIEAAEKSGALITAKTALDQNREVFAAPGSVFSPTSRGTHALLKKGAHLATSADDIIEILDFKKIVEYNENKKIIPETEEQKRILENLTDEPIHIDSLCRNLKMDAPILSSALMMMEMKGMAKNLGGSMYVIGR
ncbi:MAG: DNA-processing protein DprA [bacterium]